MDVAAITQLVTLLGVGMALIWHQQHSTTQIRKETEQTTRSCATTSTLPTANQKLRDETRADNQALRDETRADNQALRDETRADNQALREETRADNQALREETRADNQALREDHNTLRDAIAQNGQRLARIEGRLEIAVPLRLEIAVPLAGDDPKETATG